MSLCVKYELGEPRTVSIVLGDGTLCVSDPWAYVSSMDLENREPCPLCWVMVPSVPYSAPWAYVQSMNLANRELCPFCWVMVPSVPYVHT